MPDQQLEYVNCNLCKSNNFKKLYSVKADSGFSYPHPLTYVKCNNCGLVYTNPRPVLKRIREQYESELYHPKISGKSINYLGDILKANFKKLIFIEKYKKQGKLLDVGCASGILLDLARLRGWDVCGVEFAETTSKVAKNDFKLNVFNGVLEDSDFKSNFFDLIVSFNTLEHMRDPFSFLKKSHTLLKKEGLLIVETPSLDSIHYSLFGKKWGPASDLSQHLYLFNKKNLKKMLEKAGFEVIGLKLINSWTPWFLKREAWFKYLVDTFFRIISRFIKKEALMIFICVKIVNDRKKA